MKNKKNIWRALIACFCLLAGLSAQAQTGLPPSAEPERQNLREDFKTPALPTAPVEEDVLPEAAEEAPEVAGPEVSFRLTFIMIEGLTAFRVEDFVPLYNDRIGKKVGMGDLQKIAGEIQKKYREKGYLLARVAIPQQQIMNGVVYLRVTEGGIDKVLLEGDKVVAAPLQEVSERIGRTRPINSEALEHELLMLNDLPGVAVRSTLTPSALGDGSSDLHIKMSYKKSGGSIGVDNRGSKYVGPWQWNFEGYVNTLFSGFDRTGLQVVASPDHEELSYFRLYHQTPLGGHGLSLLVDGTYSLSEPGSTLQDLQVASVNRNLSAQLSYPLQRSLAENLSIYGKFEYRNSKINSLGDRLSEDRLRVARLGFSYDKTNPMGAITSLGMEVSQGLGIFRQSDGVRHAHSRARGRPDFLKVTFDGSYLRRLSDTMNVSFSSKGQYAAHTLLSGEEFGYGGSRFGGAYDASELTGEHGLAGRLEVNWMHPYFQGSALASQWYLYTDSGIVWNRDGDSQPSQSAGVSLGAGLRLSHRLGYSSSLELAQPVGKGLSAKESEEDNNPRLFFSLSREF